MVDIENPALTSARKINTVNSKRIIFPATPPRRAHKSWKKPPTTITSAISVLYHNVLEVASLWICSVSCIVDSSYWLHPESISHTQMSKISQSEISPTIATGWKISPNILLTLNLSHNVLCP